MATDKQPDPLKLLEDHIGEHLRASEASGELRSAPSYGRPLQFNDGYDDTPAELRMAMKILHDAGVVPVEVELMRRLAALRCEAAAAGDPDEAGRLRRKASELEALIALRLEHLRGGTL
ncbi:MAG TPA: DnaJ family domain-containing protein [Burkholderiaceae bacterium]|nr:DnaJ family domain-containing protein [Burkholderiaceae bacterium]